MRVREFHLGPLETNCFLLSAGGKAVIIDVGGDPAEALACLEADKLTLERILITHLHFDHVLGAAALQKATGAKIFCNERDAPLLDWQRGGNMGIPPVPEFAFEKLDEGPLTVLGAECRVLATPGHSPGSLSYYFQDLGSLFGGDVLFYRSVGRTDLPGGDADTLAASIKNKIYTLPDETRVYPGHGPDTTVELEKQSNPFVR